MKVPLSLLFVFLAAAGAGWLVAPRHSGSPATLPGTGSLPNGKSGDRGKGLNRSSGMPEEVSSLLAPVREARSPAERMRATVDLARKLPLSELKEWYAKGWFGMPGSIEAEVFMHIIRDRWVAGQPQEAMTFLLGRDQQEMRQGMQEWARLDPAAAFDFAAGCKDRSKAEALLILVIQSLGSETDPALVMARLSKLRGSSVSVFTMRPLLALAAKLSPEQLARDSAAWPMELRTAAQGALDGVAFMRDPSAAIATLSSLGEAEAGRRFFAVLDSGGGANLDAIMSRVGEWPQGWLKQVLADRPAWLVNRDPAAWVSKDLSPLGLSDVDAWRVRETAFRTMRDDPGTLLAVLHETTEGTPEQHQAMVARILTRQAGADLEKAEALLASLSDPAEIAAARKAIDEVMRKQADPNPAPLTPAQRLERLLGGPGDSSGGRESMEDWSVAEATAAVNGFRQLPPERKDELAGKMADSFSQDLQPAFQGELISWLLANPPPDAANDPQAPVVKYIYSMASKWSSEDPIAASRWAQSLPAGRDRKQALGGVANKWAESEPSAVRKWIATLPEEDRGAVEERLKQGW